MLQVVAPGLSAAMSRTLLAEAQWRDAEAGAVLTTQGQSVGGLIYIASGTVEVIVDSRVAATCSAGDFLGEMTWATGAPATATTRVREPVRYAWFERSTLGAKLRRLEVLRFAVQASISRNLTAKLLRATTRVAA